MGLVGRVCLAMAAMAAIAASDGAAIAGDGYSYPELGFVTARAQRRRLYSLHYPHNDINKYLSSYEHAVGDVSGYPYMNGYMVNCSLAASLAEYSAFVSNDNCRLMCQRMCDSYFDRTWWPQDPDAAMECIDRTWFAGCSFNIDSAMDMWGYIYDVSPDNSKSLPQIIVTTNWTVHVAFQQQIGPLVSFQGWAPVSSTDTPNNVDRSKCAAFPIGVKAKAGYCGMNDSQTVITSYMSSPETLAELYPQTPASFGFFKTFGKQDSSDSLESNYVTFWVDPILFELAPVRASTMVPFGYCIVITQALDDFSDDNLKVNGCVVDWDADRLQFFGTLIAHYATQVSYPDVAICDSTKDCVTCMNAGCHYCKYEKSRAGMASTFSQNLTCGITPEECITGYDECPAYTGPPTFPPPWPSTENIWLSDDWQTLTADRVALSRMQSLENFMRQNNLTVADLLFEAELSKAQGVKLNYVWDDQLKVARDRNPQTIEELRKAMHMESLDKNETKK